MISDLPKQQKLTAVIGSVLPPALALAFGVSALVRGSWVDVAGVAVAGGLWVGARMIEAWTAPVGQELEARVRELEAFKARTTNRG